jgi:hypothetical protein
MPAMIEPRSRLIVRRIAPNSAVSLCSLSSPRAPAKPSMARSAGLDRGAARGHLLRQRGHLGIVLAALGRVRDGGSGPNHPGGELRHQPLDARVFRRLRPSGTGHQQYRADGQ